ncbi:MAG: 16S rRNA (guanine(966)-N(2))-methyltransferase RsmD [Erysipelotrichaceae bacterium]|nr:16S rRNA (guanine(966)-N(2))-methyltransferase RsmD [Erysipelotrichaceae bacterium]
MRIVAGRYKSRLLIAPNNTNTRPTSDRAREAIFNIIAPYVLNSNVLDVFAGSGALGLEAISRGASNVTFIDIDNSAILAIKENAKNLNVLNQCIIINDDYHILNNMKCTPFDIILLDPPYALNVIDEFVEMIVNNNLLSPKGVIVYESDVTHKLNKEFKGFTLKVKKYGIAYVNVLFKNR